MLRLISKIHKGIKSANWNRGNLKVSYVIVRKKVLLQNFPVLNLWIDTQILMCARPDKSDCLYKKTNQGEVGLIPWKILTEG